MCTAYEIGKKTGSFPSVVKARAVREMFKSGKSRIVRPTHQAPVILPGGESAEMAWGFRRQFAAKRAGGKPIKRTVVNSREDKLGSPMWRDAFLHRRCLIPATAFFEWTERHGRAVPLRFTPRTDGLLWIAGIWEDSPEHGLCYSMITTEPTDAIAPVHDRMPAVLADEAIAPFLDGSLDIFGPSPVPLDFAEAENFLKPPSDQGELF